MQYYVSATGPRDGCGLKDKPFRKISQAANIAQPGDEIIVAPGIYREWVNPKFGGEEQHPITYRAEIPGTAVITGSELVKCWQHFEGDVWKAVIGNGLFGSYNPYTTVISGDWYHSDIPFHTGEVYLNGKSMFEVPSINDVLNPTLCESAWDTASSMYKWYTEQEDGRTAIYANFLGADPNAENVEINVRRNCFAPDRTGINYITVSGFVIKQAATTWAPPTAFQDGMVAPHWSRGWIIEDCEISDSKCSGISLGKYLQPNNENKWSVGRLKQGTQTERDAICQAQFEGWTKENIGSHTVRRCNIHHCEQTGIVGHLGGVFSVIEDNHIHHINNKQQLTGAEIGGIKMHAAIDVIFRRNHIHHCTRGLWLDWQAQGTRVTQNLFHHNMLPPHAQPVDSLSLAEDLFIEVSHGPTLVDNNLFLSAYAGRLSAQGVAYVHNLITGPFTWVGAGCDNDDTKHNPRYTPYHFHHRTEVAGFMSFLHGDVRFYNNIFVQQPIDPYEKFFSRYKIDLNGITGTHPYSGYPTPEEYFPRFFSDGINGYGSIRDKYYDPLPIYTGGNIFMAGAKPCDKEKNFAISDTPVTFDISECDGKWTLKTNVFRDMPTIRTDFVSTEVLGEAFEPEQRFENPDGSDIMFNEDYFGNHRGVVPVCGPIELFDKDQIEFVIWGM